MNFTFSEMMELINLTFSGMGLLLVIFGWVIPYKQNIKLEKKRHKQELLFQERQWEKDYIDQQISFFYGPISSLLLEQNIGYQQILKILNRSQVFEKIGDTVIDLPENEQKIWIHFIDTYTIPLNNKIIEIIREKKHLIYNSEIPAVFHKYYEYAIGWELLDNQKRNDISNNYHYRFYYDFPSEFEKYINETLTLLLKKQAQLMNDVTDI